MIFNWKHYFEFAKELYNNKDQFSNEDACLRSVISRAYYSMHHQVMAHAWFAPYVLPGPSEGNRLVHFLLNQKDEDTRKIGLKLERLKKYRTISDYFLSQKFNTEKSSNTSIILAEELGEILDSLGK